MTTTHVEIEHPEKLAVRPCIGHQCLAMAILDDARCRYAVMRVAAQYRVDSGHPGGELEIDVHSVMRQQNDRLGPFGTYLGHYSLQFFFLNAERPVGYQMARICDRGIRIRLTDHRDHHAPHSAQCIRRKYGIAEVRSLQVLRQEFDAAFQIVLDNRVHSRRTQRVFPVRAHHVHAQKLAGAHHVLPLCPQGGCRALPGVTTVEKQRIRP